MIFSSPKLGIDLGTANVLVFIPGKGIVINEPSVVALEDGANTVLAVGIEAKQMVGRTPDSIKAYRPMKDGVIADYRVTEAMLRYFFNKALGKFRLTKPEVMISVPAGVTSTERRAVIEAAERAGAKKAFVVKEPILAAIGAGIPIYAPEGHMIVDIGGGTVDAAVIALGGIVTAKSVKCAGMKIDRALADYVKKTFNLAIGERTAEKIKIKVGGAMYKNPKDEKFVEIKGRDYITGLPRSVMISTNQVVDAIDAELRTIVRTIKDALQETPPELASDIIDNGIIMTGGSSLLRDLPSLIEQRIGVRARLAKDALYCVAHGTGEALTHLDSYKKALMSKTSRVIN